MRHKLITGMLLGAAPVLAVALSSLLDLELEPVALLGVATGAVVGLVPDRSPLVRLGGLAAGLLVAWVGYLVRASMLPDIAGGRAAAFALIMVACVVIAATWRAVPLWSLLVGVVAVSGAYEYTYSAAPTEVVSASLSMVTALVLTLAVGFLAALLAEGAGGPRAAGPRSAPPSRDPERTTSSDATLDQIMEPTK